MPLNPRRGLRSKKPKETRFELTRRLAREAKKRKKERERQRMLDDLQFDLDVSRAKSKGNARVVHPEVRKANSSNKGTVKT